MNHTKVTNRAHREPTVQQALMALGFSSRSFETPEQQRNIRLIDSSIQAATLSTEHRRLLLILSKQSILDHISVSSQNVIGRLHQRTIYRNSLLISQLHNLELALRQCGFEQMIGLKGLSVIAHSFGDVGSRYMSDVDVLIPNLQKQPQAALKVFESQGLTKVGSNFRSVTLSLARELTFDLHWYLHDWALDPSLIDLVRERSVTKTIGQFDVRVPCVEHHLAHTIAHGIFSANEINCRWMFDVLTVLRDTKDIDMNRFGEYSNRLAAPKAIGDALTALARELPADIELDRSLLIEMSGRIKPKSRVVYWLHNRSLVDSPHTQTKVRPSRLSLVKQLLISGVYLPWLTKRYGQATFWQFWGWRQSFPPPSTWACIRGFGKEIWQRGPQHLLRIFRGAKRGTGMFK